MKLVYFMTGCGGRQIKVRNADVEATVQTIEAEYSNPFVEVTSLDQSKLFYSNNQWHNPPLPN